MKYTVMGNENIVDLIKAVNEQITEGWEPLGGISVSISHDTNNREPKYVKSVYAQAMVRKTR